MEIILQSKYKFFANQSLIFVLPPFFIVVFILIFYYFASVFVRMHYKSHLNSFHFSQTLCCFINCQFTLVPLCLFIQSIVFDSCVGLKRDDDL